MSRVRLFIFVALLLCLPAVGRSQATLAGRPDPLHVYLYTYGPGEEPWEKFGHDGVGVYDQETGMAVPYNWGIFDFGKGLSGIFGFGWHFLPGRLVYSMGGYYTDDMLEMYRTSHRSVRVQELRFTRAQKVDLLHRLEANDTDANRYYLYDYFQKNCTTMARDALDQTLDGRIHQTLKDLPTGTTYRWHDRRATSDLPNIWLYFFLDFILGQPVDKPLSAWQESFLPKKLADHLLSVQVPDFSGQMVPFVMSDRSIPNGAAAEPQAPPRWQFWGFLATGILLGGVLATLAFLGRRLRFFRWVFALSVMIWSLPMGLLGALATFALFTNHEAAKWNENWFQGNPASLALIVLMPMSFRWPGVTRKMGMILLGLSAFGLVAKITPWFWQVNGAIIALALPVHAAIAWGIWLVAWLRVKPPAVQSAEQPHRSEAVDAA